MRLHILQKIPFLALLATVIYLFFNSSGHAAGCIYPGVSAQGPVRASIQSARYAAMGAWERKVAKVRGRRYGVWNQAGDQSVDCSWNDRGNRIRCRATAAACSF